MKPFAHPTMFAVAACALMGVATVGAQDEQICSIHQARYELGFRDAPDTSSDFVLCLETRLSPTIADKYVHCRMHWKLAAINQEGRRRCEDFDYLYATGKHPFPDSTGDSGDELCLVRQVTQAQQAAGTSGWYYLDDATQRCSRAQAGVVFPLDRPEHFEVVLECGLAVEPEGAFGSADIPPSQCVAPPSAADASDVGKQCSQPLQLDEQSHQLTFGGDECASDVCLTTPLGALTCTEQDGVGYCGSSTTRCSCRCAGESDDDPGPFCDCPDAYECKPLLTRFVGSPETRGSYCVPTDGRVVP